MAHNLMNCGIQKRRMQKMVLSNFEMIFIFIGRMEGKTKHSQWTLKYYCVQKTTDLTWPVACSVSDGANGSGAFVTFALHFFQLKSHKYFLS